MTISQSIKKYGENAVINGIATKAVIYPVDYKSKMYMAGTETEIGTANESVYVIIAPPEINLKAAVRDTAISADSGEYLLYHGEKFCLFGRCIYSFAYLRRRVADEL